ncbi:MAG: SH3 domain-containing protein, partial [Dehalococcoidia bacterium]
MSTASRRPERRLFFRSRLWIVAVLILTTFGAVFLPPAREAAAAPAWTTTWLNLRTGPGTNYDVILVMEPGAYVEIVQNKQNGFYRVRYQGVSGWAALQYLDRSGGGGGDDGGGDDGGGGGGGGNTTVTSTLNLRSSPWGSVITVMPAGASVTVTGSGQNGFLPVTYNGRSGWAHSDYLDTGASGPGAAPAPPSGPAVGSATVTSALNLRAGPSTGTSVLAVMPSGATVEILGDPRSGFYPVRYNGTAGYAYADYLSLGGGDGDGNGGGDGWTEQEIISIIYAAADQYGQPRADMLRVARCESGLDPSQVTPPYQASGLFQFLPGTWATTPY